SDIYPNTLNINNVSSVKIVRGNSSTAGDFNEVYNLKEFIDINEANKYLSCTYIDSTNNSYLLPNAYTETFTYISDSYSFSIELIEGYLKKDDKRYTPSELVNINYSKFSPTKCFVIALNEFKIYDVDDKLTDEIIDISKLEFAETNDTDDLSDYRYTIKGFDNPIYVYTNNIFKYKDIFYKVSSTYNFNTLF
ncbi:MAG: hypothetical protein K6G28_03705, partial [Acholeplasmatales bacterium]|nr:hypothetical protein [Acholeplasmatales bacterium]